MYSETEKPLPTTTTTTSTTTSVPPPVVRRRGRGTFNQPLRADQPTTVTINNNNNNAANDGASVLTTVTTAVLPAASIVSSQQRAPEEHLAAEYGGQKRDIPLNMRENFGVCETEHEADTVRQLLFRGEKRRRYCVIVGELQNPNRPITLKLFGHKGLKPFKLQNKLIRLVNISVGRPRAPRPAMDGTEDEMRHHNDDDSENNSDEEHQEVEKGEKEVRHEEMNNNNNNNNNNESGQLQEEREGSYSKQQEQQEQDETSIPKEERSPQEDHHEDEKSDQHNSATRTGRSSCVHEDVDGYTNLDDVLPLTVEMRDANATNIGQPSSVANSPVLTATRFDTLQKYFFNEFKYLLSLEDVRMQHVSINLNLGAAYCCLAREGSYSTPLKYASFSEFVQRMNEESMQLYFLKDAPACVSRAVDRECGALQSEAVFSLVKICFFSNERQSRSVARALWDAHENRFVLLDMENSGVTFTWTVFSVDETGIESSGANTTNTNNNNNNNNNNTSTTGSTDGNGAFRKKTVAFPFELELHAYRRWKQHTEHPAAPIAEAILDKLSLAEHNLIHYGSTIGYESMDLSHVCEVDAESEDFNVESIIVEHTARVKPRGTDLTVDSTSSLWIENFAAARALKNRLAQGLVDRNSSVYSSNNNNNSSSMGGHSGRDRTRGRGRGPPLPHLSKPQTLTPTSRLTFFRSRGSTVHWKLRPGCSAEENLAPLSEALRFAQQVINTANEIERTSVRGGAAPDAL
ncbi:uncharacterized protein TM35_000212080 [Trypanosoma theileri]|uniref:Uncharacterized protein n=1 Tax=Trypanosoma theileri TaxID=67003 RepID=A0A1X0NSC7_9TRYP|nr:uncharacterized protein TM35_000212080 [Trypanosoma theileri]ORC87602.1 hypothetical protein TM35_000212080 [Trypanosoma theileri]